MPGLLYRVRQFWRALNAPPLTPEETRRVQTVLPDAAFALYQTMPPGDQRHALVIFDALVAQGYRAHPLLQAALLHDAAKRRIGLGYRTCVIVLNKLLPRALEHIARAEPKDWRYPFYISLHHPELSAELAARAGMTEPTLSLIRAHQTNTPSFPNSQLCEWHRALKQLDDVN
jgi:hypothetical protein